MSKVKLPYCRCNFDSRGRGHPKDNLVADSKTKCVASVTLMLEVKMTLY